MGRLRTIGWETQRLSTTSVRHGENVISSTTGIVSVGTTAIDTTVPRSGQACLAISGAATRYESATLLGNVLGVGFFQRAGFRFTATQAAAQRIMEFASSAGTRVCRVVLATNDKLQLTNGADVQVGADSPVLSHDHWYRLELKAIVAASPSSSNGILEVRLYDDTTNLLIWNVATAATDLLSAAIDGARVGNTGASATIGTLYFDDWAINSDAVGTDQISWPGNGKVVLLKPVSDNARVVWTAGAGATTNMFDAVNNTPPIGVAAASGTNASQIKNPNSGTTHTYDANVGAYSDSVASGGGGMTVGDVVSLVQALARFGTETTTSRQLGVNNLSNPGPGTEAIADSGTAQAAGTDPTGYASRRNTIQYAPSVTLATKPVVRVRKNANSTDIMVCDLMGLMVEFRPSDDAVSGAVAFSGALVEGKLGDETVAGSCAVAGTAIDSRSASEVVGGALSVAGGVDETRGYVDAVAGILTVAGTRVEVRGYVEAPAGDVAVSGELTDDFGGLRDVDGTVLLVGGALEQRVYPDSAEGTVATDGTVTESIGLGFADQVEGLVTLFGLGSENFSASRDRLGVVALGGRRRESVSTYGADRLATYAGGGVATYDEE